MNWKATPMNQVERRVSEKRRPISSDDARRPVWLEATESFYKKLNRIARLCDLSRYEALSRGLDALRREVEVRNSALNPISGVRVSRRYFVERWGRFHATTGRRSARRRNGSAAEGAPMLGGAGTRESNSTTPTARFQEKS
jgi:hypothetical protein